MGNFNKRIERIEGDRGFWILIHLKKVLSFQKDIQ